MLMQLLLEMTGKYNKYYEPLYEPLYLDDDDDATRAFFMAADA